MSTDIRERVRSRAAGRKRKPKVERTYPPELSEFEQDVRVLAFDQTLTKTAWVMTEVVHNGVHVWAKGMLKQRTERTGFMETYDKAAQLREAAWELLRRFQSGSLLRPDVIVAECPAVGGYRIESSLMAGFVLYETFGAERVNWVNAQHVKSVLGGPTCKEKADLKPVLAQLRPDSGTREWNEDQRDALANGLGYLWDRKAGSR